MPLSDDEEIVKDWWDSGVGSGDNLQSVQRQAEVLHVLRHNMESNKTAVNALYQLTKRMIGTSEKAIDVAQSSNKDVIDIKNRVQRIDEDIWGVPNRDHGAVGRMEASVDSIRKTMWMVTVAIVCPLFVASVVGILNLVSHH